MGEGGGVSGGGGGLSVTGTNFRYGQQLSRPCWDHSALLISNGSSLCHLNMINAQTLFSYAVRLVQLARLLHVMLTTSLVIPVCLRVGRKLTEACKILLLLQASLVKYNCKPMSRFASPFAVCISATR